MDKYRHKIINLYEEEVIEDVEDDYAQYAGKRLKPQLNNEKLITLLDEESQGGWEFVEVVEFFTEWRYFEGKVAIKIKYKNRRPFGTGIPLKILFRQKILEEHPYR